MSWTGGARAVNVHIVSVGPAHHFGRAGRSLLAQSRMYQIWSNGQAPIESATPFGDDALRRRAHIHQKLRQVPWADARHPAGGEELRVTSTSAPMMAARFSMDKLFY